MTCKSIFTAETLPQVTQNDIAYIAVPNKFREQGAVGESQFEFDEYCKAMSLVNDAIENSSELSEAIATLLNRAHALGAIASK